MLVVIAIDMLSNYYRSGPALKPVS